MSPHNNCTRPPQSLTHGYASASDLPQPPAGVSLTSYADVMNAASHSNYHVAEELLQPTIFFNLNLSAIFRPLSLQLRHFLPLYDTKIRLAEGGRDGQYPEFVSLLGHFSTPVSWTRKYPTGEGEGVRTKTDNILTSCSNSVHLSWT